MLLNNDVQTKFVQMILYFEKEINIHYIHYFYKKINLMISFEQNLNNICIFKVYVFCNVKNEVFDK